MSDTYQMLVDPKVEISEAKQFSKEILARLRKLGLIAGRLTTDCTFGGKGYRPGPDVPRLYKLGQQECGFWDLHKCGVEPKIGREFNFMAIGPVCTGLTCPKCQTSALPLSDAFAESLGKAMLRWMDNLPSYLLRCPQCKKQTAITKWECIPPFGFGHMAFTFWNWPPFDSQSWRIDIPAIFEEITGHKPISSFGRM